MKKVFVMLLALMAGVQLFAQDEEYKRQQEIYQRALNYNDFFVARTALYNMLAIKPESSNLLDSLSLLYFEQKQYVSAGIIAQEAAKINANNLLALEVAATSFENIGLLDKALEYWEPLYLKNNDINILYKIAFLQYRLKRYNDAATSADIVMKNARSTEVKLVFGKQDQTTQQVSLKAAAQRLKGLVEMDKGNNSAAITEFQKALEIAPDFELVKLTIAELQKEK